MRYWKPGDIFEVVCPNCGAAVEFFKDEANRRCRSCKNMVPNPRMNFGCAAYCQFAEQCLGELGPEGQAIRNNLLKDRLAVEVKKLLGRDFKGIAHTISIARFAEELAREEGAKPAPLLCAAYVHIFQERTEGDGATGRQAIGALLERLGASPDMANQVLEIVDHFATGKIANSIEEKVFRDAHLLASYEERKADTTPGAEEGTLEERIARCLTGTCKRLMLDMAGNV